MSGLAGILHLRPQGTRWREEFQAVSRALNHRGSPCLYADARTVLSTFSRSGSSGSIPRDGRGRRILWHGTLHNRKEILRKLLLKPSDAGHDSRIALAAWGQWGPAALQHLIGDFSFAIWDPSAAELFAARDPGGLRPFFFSRQQEQFSFASEVRALLQAPGVSRDLDEHRIADFLLWWSDYPDQERTFFEDIHRLPPGCWLRWNRQGLTVQTAWKLDVHRRVIYPKTSDYQERFQEMFCEAVRCRLQHHAPTGIFLSGGLDSSAVAVQAARLGGNLRAYTGKVPDAADESHLAAAVALHAGIPHQIFLVPPTAVGPHVESFVARQASPVADLGFVNDNLLIAAAQKDGCRTLLTGDGGDEALGSPIGYLADLIRTGRLLQLRSVLKALAGFHSRSEASLVKAALLLLAPRWCKRAARFWRWREAPAWIHPELARRTNLLQRLRRVPAEEQLASISATEDFVALFRGRRIWMDEAREIEAAHHGVSFTYPFLDRRLMEFLFAIPWDVRMQGARNKALLRNWKGLLPPAIREIRAKANYASYWEQTTSLSDWSPGGLQPRLAFERFLNPDFFTTAASGKKGPVLRTAPPVTFWTTHRFLLWLHQYGLPDTGHMKPNLSSEKRPEKAAENKPFEAPRLKRLGSLQELTKAFSGPINDGFLNMTRN